MRVGPENFQYAREYSPIKFNSHEAQFNSAIADFARIVELFVFLLFQLHVLLSDKYNN